MAIDARITVGALTPVALRQIYTSGTVVARLRRALVNIDFAASSGEAGRTIAVYTVSHWHAKTAMLTYAVGALNRLALFAADRTRSVRIHVCGTFDARGRTVLRLEEVLGTLSARSESRIRVHARRTLSAATIATRRGWLVSECSSWTSLAVLVASNRRLAGVAVSGTLEARHETGR